MRKVRRLGSSVTSFWALVIILLVTGAGLVIITHVLSGAAWLGPLSPAAIGAGLALIVSKRTAEAAASQTYRKDAILTYKSDLYLPLHSEFKRACMRMRGARARQEAYPQTIEMATSTDALQLIAPVADPTTVLLQSWALFRADFRIERFSRIGRQRFDTAVEQAQRYNDAVEGTRKAVEDMLAAELAAAIDRTRQSRDFQEWRRAQPDWVRRREQGNWFTLLDSHRASGDYEPADELAATFAKTWMHSAVFGRRPSTLGWLLAGAPDRAAQGLHMAYNNTDPASLDPFVPLEWVTSVMQGTWLRLETLPVYQAFQATAQQFFDAVCAAEQHLADGLLMIRDRYEGGEPLV